MERKLDRDRSLGEQLLFGSQDDLMCEGLTKQMLENVTCHDLQQLLNGESFNPLIFASYIKLTNYMHEIRLDCSRVLESVFVRGERVPKWANASAVILKRLDDASGNKGATAAFWNRVSVLDPPELKWGEAHPSQANTTHYGTAHDGSVMVVKSNMDDSMLSRYSAIAKREVRRQEEMVSYQLATAQKD